MDSRKMSETTDEEPEMDLFRRISELNRRFTLRWADGRSMSSPPQQPAAQAKVGARMTTGSELVREKMQDEKVSSQQQQQQQQPAAQAKVGARMTAGAEAKEEAKSRPPPDQMTDEERERRYTRFYGEGADGPMRKIIEAPWMEQLLGPRFKGYGLGTLRQAMEDARRRKEEEGQGNSQQQPEPAPEREKIHLEEEQEKSQTPLELAPEREKIHSGEEQDNWQPPSEPAPEREKIHLEEGQENSQPLPRLWPVNSQPVNSQLQPRRKPKRQKIQWAVGQRNSQPPPRPEPIRKEQQQGSSTRPEPIQGRQEQVSSQPPPPTLPSEQAKVRFLPSTFPREGDNPSTSNTDECGEWTVAPYDQDPDPEAAQYFNDMAEYYLAAASRLPIAQMPQLAGVLSFGGLLLGFHDPVTNIIVNTIYLMEKSCYGYGALPRGTDPVRHAADRASYVDIARKSRAALLKFMTFYFRHLTEAQAKRFLRAARHDLVVAIGLVELQWRGPDEILVLNLCSCNRTKTALRYAAKAAMLMRDPDDLARIMTSRFPCNLLDPVLDDLRRGEQLSVGHVKGIINLLSHPWSPPPSLPAPTTGTFRDADGNITIIVNIGQDLFSTTTITKDRVAAFSNGEGNQNGDTITTTISRHPSHQDINEDLAATAYLSTRTTGDGAPSCMNIIAPNHIRFIPQVRQDTMSLMMCLMDTIHGFYIQALAMLPSDHLPLLLHAVLADGHCYGILNNPVHNIIINSIWYKLCYLPQKDETVQIHHTPPMTRIMSLSLKGLINYIVSSSFDKSIHSLNVDTNVSLYLIKVKCGVGSEFGMKGFLTAAQAAKHPHPAALVKFMECLLPFKDLLCSLMSSKHVLSNTDFDTISEMIAAASAPVPRTCDLCQPALMDPDCFMQAYVCKKLEEVLLNYGRKDPLGPQCKLGIICGVASKIFSLYNRDIACYHANFLASTGDVPGYSFFFAEFWDRADDGWEVSKRPPVCCRVPHEDKGGHMKYHCRCFICESDAVKVVHPPNVNYFMGHSVHTDALCAAAEHDWVLANAV